MFETMAIKSTTLKTMPVRFEKKDSLTHARQTTTKDTAANFNFDRVNLTRKDEDECVIIVFLRNNEKKPLAITTHTHTVGCRNPNERPLTTFIKQFD